MRGRNVTREELMEILKRVAERRAFISDYVKSSDGRIVRFVNWKGGRR